MKTQPPRYYRRNLPHIQPEGVVFAVNYRLAGSLPIATIMKLKKERDENLTQIAQRESHLLKQYKGAVPINLLAEFEKLRHQAKNQYEGKFNELLDRAESGPAWLKNPEIAQIVKDSLHYLENDRKICQIIAYCIMPNHVHLIVSNVKPVLHILLKLHKQFTARKANLLLNRTGNSFWQKESYDHIIRSVDELQYQIEYVLNNPVKAGLEDDWTVWPHSYLNKDMYGVRL